jgi:hypothetical protein
MTGDFESAVWVGLGYAILRAVPSRKDALTRRMARCSRSFRITGRGYIYASRHVGCLGQQLVSISDISSLSRRETF